MAELTVPKVCMSVVLVVQLVTWLGVGVVSGNPSRRAINDCDDSRRVSEICYQCAENHGSFVQVFEMCCGRDQEDVREYCEHLYTEPPKRGGLWRDKRAARFDSMRKQLKRS